MPYIGNIVQDFSVNNAMLNTDSVTSIKIDDGTIVNADINDSAAIAMSKLALSITNSEINASAAIAVSKLANFVTNNADNRLITGSGTANTLNGEANLTFTGSILTVTNSSGAAELTLVTPSNTDGGVYFNDGSNTGALTYQHSDDSMRFRVNSTEKMRIDSSGRLLLGTTTEGVANASEFTIADTGHCGMTIRSGTSHDGQIAFSDGTSGDDEFRGQIRYNHGSNYLTFVTDATERMRIDSSGAVRIGHTDAIGNASADNLVIGTGSGNNGLSIYSGNDSQGRIDFRDTTGTSDGQGIIFYQHTTDSLQIHTNSAERMRIDSSGRLGLGLTPNTSAVATNVSAGLFQTDGNIDIRYAGTNSDPAGARYLNFINTDTTLVNEQPMGGIHWIGNDTSNPNNINCSFTALNSGSGGGSGMFIFKTAGSERFRISPTGNVGINTTSPAHKLDLDNGSARFNRGNSAGEILTLRGLNANQFRFDTDGLKFGSDTAAANALDDYEEGTFSPTFGASNGSSTTTYTTQQGAYTKIGNTVFFNIYIVLNSISTNTHSVIVIGALPFTNTSNRVSIHSIRSSGFQGSGDDSRPFAGTVEANNTKIELVKAANGGTSDFTTSNSQGGTTVYIAGQYPVS